MSSGDVLAVVEQPIQVPQAQMDAKGREQPGRGDVLLGDGLLTFCLSFFTSDIVIQ